MPADDKSATDPYGSISGPSGRSGGVGDDTADGRIVVNVAARCE